MRFCKDCEHYAGLGLCGCSISKHVYGMDYVHGIEKIGYKYKCKELNTNGMCEHFQREYR